jgi:hypothetical protein
MKKRNFIASIFLMLLLMSCPLTDNPVAKKTEDTLKEIIEKPTADTLLDNMLYEIGVKMTSTKAYADSVSKKIIVKDLLVAGKTEAERRGYAISKDPVKVMPSIIYGITNELLESEATAQEKISFSREAGAIYQNVLKEESLKLPTQGQTTWNQRDLTSKVAPAIVGPLANHRAEGASGRTRSSRNSLTNKEIEEILSATLSGYISILPADNADSAKELISTIVHSSVDNLARSGVKDPSVYSSVLTGVADGLSQPSSSRWSWGSDRKALLVDSVKSSGEIIEALNEDGVLTDNTIIDSITDDISTSIEDTTKEWGDDSIASTESATALDSGLADPVTIADMIIEYPELDIDTEKEFLVLKFQTITKVEKEEFWRGAVGTGTLVGEVLYNYDEEGNITSKEWKYNGKTWVIDNKFKFDGLRMIEDNNGHILIYDDLGRIIDYNTYNKYEYSPDGSVTRNYNTGTGSGNANYEIKYKMGTTPVGSGYYWYGNHSTTKWMSWYDDDRYDIVSGLYTLTSKDKIESIIHNYTNFNGDGDEIGKGSEAMHFNDIGKLIQFDGGLKEDGAPSGQNFYDPLQRIKLNRKFNWDTGKKEFDIIYSYDLDGNVSAVKKHFNESGEIILEETFVPNDVATNPDTSWQDPRTTVKAERTEIKNNTEDILLPFPARYLIGDFEKDKFIPFEVVDPETLVYEFKYSNSMNALGSENGVLKFKLTAKDNIYSTQFVAGETDILLNATAVVLKSTADGAEVKNIHVWGLIDGLDYKITVTTNGIQSLLKIENDYGTAPQGLHVGYIAGDILGSDGQVPPLEVTKKDNGLYEFTFSYSNTMTAWGGSNGVIGFKLLSDTSWTTVYSAPSEAPLALNATEMVLVTDKDAKAIILTGLEEGKEYKLIIETTTEFASIKAVSL